MGRVHHPSLVLSGPTTQGVVKYLRWLLSFCAAVPLAAQQPVFTLVIRDAVRDSLAKAWDEHDATQFERGYCVTYEASMDQQRNPHFEIVGFLPPDSVGQATPVSIWFHCPRSTFRLHTHTPTTCDTSRDSIFLDTCRMGGPEAWVCAPSWGDLMSLAGSGKLMELIQCDRHAIVAFGRPRGFHPLPDSAGTP
jgi:hypothetical protein